MRRCAISAWESLQQSEEPGHTCPATSGSCYSYQSFVLPQFDYCSVVWSSSGATLAKSIKREQNCAHGLILWKPPLTSSDSLRQTLGWTTMETRRQNALLCQVYCCITNQAPSFLCFTFTSNSSLHYAEAQDSAKLHLPHSRTKFYHTSFEFQGAKTFKNLPKTIRELKERKLFRDAVLRHSRGSNLYNCIIIFFTEQNTILTTLFVIILLLSI